MPPIEVHLDEARRCVVARVTGDFTLRDIIDAVDGGLRDPRFRPGFGIFSDHTAVGEPLTAEQADGMIQHLKSLGSIAAGVRWAMVTSRPASYGMLRMVSALARTVPMEIQVFQTRDEAFAWLAGGGTPAQL